MTNRDGSPLSFADASGSLHSRLKRLEAAHRPQMGFGARLEAALARRQADPKVFAASVKAALACLRAEPSSERRDRLLRAHEHVLAKDGPC